MMHDRCPQAPAPSLTVEQLARMAGTSPAQVRRHLAAAGELAPEFDNEPLPPDVTARALSNLAAASGQVYICR